MPYPCDLHAAKRLVIIPDFDSEIAHLALRICRTVVAINCMVWMGTVLWCRTAASQVIETSTAVPELDCPSPVLLLYPWNFGPTPLNHNRMSSDRHLFDREPEGKGEEKKGKGLDDDVYGYSKN